MKHLKDKKILPVLILGLIAVLIGYYLLNAPDKRDPFQKMGDAIGELHNGPEKAARQLEDRTPGDKIIDVIQDEKKDLKKSLNQE